MLRKIGIVTELRVVQQPPNAPAFGPDTVVWRTCVRQVAFLDDHAAVPRGIAAWHDEAAYAHLLEVVCGLHSPIVGETEVLHQFKVFTDALPGELSPLRDVCTRLLADARTIRARHLIGLGSRSYGSAVRRYVRASGRIAMIGTGVLAREIVPFLVRADRAIDLWGRRPECSIEAPGLTYRVLDSPLSPIAQPSCIVIAAPMSAAAIAQFATRYRERRRRDRSSRRRCAGSAAAHRPPDQPGRRVCRFAAGGTRDRGACRGGEGRDSATCARVYDARQAESVRVARPVRVRLLSRASALGAAADGAGRARAARRSSAPRRAVPDADVGRRSGSNLTAVEVARQGRVHRRPLAGARRRRGRHRRALVQGPADRDAGRHAHRGRAAARRRARHAGDAQRPRSRRGPRRCGFCRPHPVAPGCSARRCRRCCRGRSARSKRCPSAATSRPGCASSWKARSTVWWSRRRHSIGSWGSARRSNAMPRSCAPVSISASGW